VIGHAEEIFPRWSPVLSLSRRSHALLLVLVIRTGPVRLHHAAGRAPRIGMSRAEVMWSDQRRLEFHITQAVSRMNRMEQKNSSLVPCSINTPPQSLASSGFQTGSVFYCMLQGRRNKPAAQC